MTAEILFRRIGFDPLHLSWLSIIILCVIGVIAALIAVFLIVFIITCLRERRYLVANLEPAKEPYPYPLTRYWTFTRQDAIKLGWQHAGDYSTKKHTTLVNGMMSLFLSPDGSVAARIFSGATAGAKLNKTILRSRLNNGTILETYDITTIGDPTGVHSQMSLLNAGIVELSTHHAQRLQTSGASAVPFTLANALVEYQNIDWEQGAHWVQKGLAKWVEPEKVSIRMTLRGALAQVKLMSARTRAMNGQSHRMHILRAGSRPGDLQS